MAEDRCQVESVEGESCDREPHFTLLWYADRGLTPKVATVCRDCGHTWLDRFTREGRVVEVRPALRRVLPARLP